MQILVPPERTTSQPSQLPVREGTPSVPTPVTILYTTQPKTMGIHTARRTSGRLPLARQALGPAGADVALGQPAAGLDELDDVDDLLEGHDGEADAGEDPGPEAVHLVGARELERARAVGVGEDLAQQRRVDLGALVQRRRRGRVVVFGHLLLLLQQQGGGQQRGGEGEQVERDEEGLVEGAGDEEDRLTVARGTES